jgi:hypothetical protein
MLNIIIYKSISILFLTYKIEILFLLSVEDISKHQSIKASKHQSIKYQPWLTQQKSQTIKTRERPLTRVENHEKIK